jgi:hypothetical protein
MLSSFALNLRRFYRTSLIEVTTANLLAVKVTFNGLQEFYAKCREADVNGSSFLTATDLRQVLSNCGHQEVTDAISMLSSRHLRHPGESYLDYTALVAAVKARRERILEEELWQQFCAFMEMPAVSHGSGRVDTTTGLATGLDVDCRPGGEGWLGNTTTGKASETGRMPLARLSSFFETANVRASLSHDGLEDVASVVRSIHGGAVTSPEVDFIEMTAEIIKHLPSV